LEYRRLPQNPNAGKVVFTGGCSLSKAYSMENRFSEDIDNAVFDVLSYNGD
jgi:Uncharacterized conserved protein